MPSWTHGLSVHANPWVGTSSFSNSYLYLAIFKDFSLRVRVGLREPVSSKGGPIFTKQKLKDLRNKTASFGMFTYFDKENYSFQSDLLYSGLMTYKLLITCSTNKGQF